MNGALMSHGVGRTGSFGLIKLSPLPKPIYGYIGYLSTSPVIAISSKDVS